MVRQSKDSNTHTGDIDVAANRSAVKWSSKQLAGRVLWHVIQISFALSPRPLWAWRRVLLRLFGAKIGRDVHIYPTVRITIPWNLSIGDQAAVGDRAILYALGPITIGKRATISQNAHLCAGSHDTTRSDRQLIKPPIVIGADAWVAADAFIGPGVRVGEGSIVGARAVVMKDVDEGVVVAGNPARMIRQAAGAPPPARDDDDQAKD